MKAGSDELLSSPLQTAVDSPSSGAWILAATILGSSMAFIDGTIVNVAAPKLQSAFHATLVDVQWVIESYGLLLASLILAGGALGDSLGRRRIFLLGVVVFAVASAACGLAPTIQLLIVARSVQGIGAALLVPGSLSIISASFGESSRGRAIGTWSGFTAITTALGPVLGGWLIEYASWRWAFFLNIPLAAAVLLISLRHVPESRASHSASSDMTARPALGLPPSTACDWLGAGAVTASLAALVTGLLESSKLGWRSPLVIATLLGGLLLFALFLWAETRVPSPMVPLSLFKSSSFFGANLLTFLLYSAIGMFFFLLPLTLMQVHHYSATAAGAAVLPVTLLMFSLSRWAAGLVARYSGKPPLVIGPLLVSAGFLLFAVFSHGGSYWRTFFPATITLGLGMVITIAPLTTVVMGSLSKDHSGAASGINNAVARLAGVLAIAIFGIVLVKSFALHLDRSLATLPIPPQAAGEIRSKEIELAGMELPKNLDENATDLVRTAVSDAFLSGFRLVVLSCAALSLASSIVALRLIPK